MGPGVFVMISSIPAAAGKGASMTVCVRGGGGEGWGAEAE